MDADFINASLFRKSKVHSISYKTKRKNGCKKEEKETKCNKLRENTIIADRVESYINDQCCFVVLNYISWRN